jgi:hypothetical protein
MSAHVRCSYQIYNGARYIEFFDGYRISKDAFLSTLQLLEKVGAPKRQRPSTHSSLQVGSDCWKELAASAVVRVTTKVERVLPSMLMELYVLAVDVILKANPSPEGLLKAVCAMFPGAAAIVTDTLKSDPEKWIEVVSAHAGSPNAPEHACVLREALLTRRINDDIKPSVTETPFSFCERRRE